jgi:uncharacterized protein (DUF952 family)
MHRMSGEPGTSRLVVKILSASDWDHARKRGEFAGSTDDARDGYIHLSAAHQVAETAAKYFRNRPDLVLVAFDADQLGPALKWEPSRGGDLFPHLYGPLRPALSLWTKQLHLSEDGVPIIPDLSC